MTEQDFLQLKQEFEDFIDEYRRDAFSASQILRKQQKLIDGINLELGSGDGTKFGTATTQKLGFYNATPIVRPATVNDPGNVSATYVQAEVQAIVDRVKDIIARLKSLGLIA